MRIVCTTEEGVSTGTGFFFELLKNDKGRVPVVVTNRHVIAGAKSTRFFGRTVRAQSEEDIDTELQLFDFCSPNLWMEHPDPNIDLAIFPAGYLHAKAEQLGKKLVTASLSPDLLPSKSEALELEPLRGIMMIGYPNGLWDEYNNMPIFRRGAIATHPALDFDGRPEFVIDAACFPGSSGSPVLLDTRGAYVTKSGAAHIGGAGLKLLGVLYSGPVFTATGEIRMLRQEAKRPVAVSELPINLGYVIRSEEIMDFEEAVLNAAPSLEEKIIH